MFVFNFMFGNWYHIVRYNKTYFLQFHPHKIGLILISILIILTRFFFISFFISKESWYILYICIYRFDFNNISWQEIFYINPFYMYILRCEFCIASTIFFFEMVLILYDWWYFYILWILKKYNRYIILAMDTENFEY